MPNYQHILLATDFSEGSTLINDKAYELAQLMHAKLSIIHVVETLPSYGHGFVGLDEIEMQLQEASKKQLEMLGEKYHITPVDQYIEIGSPNNIIHHKAEELKADLIVIGSHERHGLDYLLGSTANAIIHSAKCDVLTVRMKHDIL